MNEKTKDIIHRVQRLQKEQKIINNKKHCPINSRPKRVKCRSRAIDEQRVEIIHVPEVSVRRRKHALKISHNNVISGNAMESEEHFSLFKKKFKMQSHGSNHRNIKRRQRSKSARAKKKVCSRVLKECHQRPHWRPI